jgi:hypothetical protein
MGVHEDKRLRDWVEFSEQRKVSLCLCSTKCWLKYLKGNVDVDGRIILKCILDTG